MTGCGAPVKDLRCRHGFSAASHYLWRSNLADEEYLVTAIDNLPHADRAVIWSKPRSFGVDLALRYQ